MLVLLWPRSAHDSARLICAGLKPRRSGRSRRAIFLPLQGGGRERSDAGGGKCAVSAAPTVMPLTPPRTPAARDPPPAGEGENKSPPFSRCVFASELCHATARKPFQDLPKKEGRRSAERRVRFIGRARRSRRAPRGECCHPSALRARSPFGAPPRCSPVGRFRHRLSSSPALPETRSQRALPAARLSQSTALRGDRS